MSSRKEEERNEKIIRGLMKLPPNRRCINCNSLGPQYVCTNFWTFVCMTCSGIHREFTHRVKSVSMAKFTSQEVEALQKGGNQRARETYLTAWDPQRQRLPDNSNVDKVREFIKNVYVDKKYALEKSSDRPPRYAQNAKGQEDETRRASSYHSYSQSPPYDYQYEERRYGKPAPGLTRKPGSDRGLYGGKLSSFLSPGRSSDHIHEDGFANDGSNPRASDYSASNGGYPLGSGGLSPSSQKDVGSPFSATSRDSTSEVARHPTVSDHADTYTRRDGGRILHPQRTSSSGSFGSFDSNSMSFASVNSFNLLEIAPDPEQSAETSQRKLSSLPPQPHGSAPASFNGLDLFSAPFVPQNFMSASSPASVIQFPEASSAQPVDLFQQSSIPSVPTSISPQSSQTLPSSLDLFAEMPQEQSSTGSNGKIPEAMSKNEGWATFDIPQRSSTGIENSTHAVIPPSDRSFLGKEDSLSLVHKPSLQGSSDHRPSADMSTLWHEGAKNFEATPKATSNQSWNAFQDTEGEQSMENTLKSSESVAPLHAADANQYLGFNTYETLGNDLFQRAAESSGPPLSSLSSHSSVMSDDFHTLPAMDGVHSNAKSQKYVNPFDLPDDYGVESSNMPQFWDMSSLQSALPNSSLPASFVGGMNQQAWFPQTPVTSYVPGGLPFDPAIGSLGFIAGQAPGNQIPNVAAQGPVASIGGNPFA